MRTTLDIDDDVLAAAKDLAKAEGKTMGQVISELARMALTAPRQTGAPGFSEAAAAFAIEDELFPRLPRSGGPPVTNELVRRIQEEIDLEDAVPWDHERNAPRSFDGEPRKQRTRPRKQ